MKKKKKSLLVLCLKAVRRMNLQCGATAADGSDDSEVEKHTFLPDKVTKMKNCCGFGLVYF